MKPNENSYLKRTNRVYAQSRDFSVPELLAHLMQWQATELCSRAFQPVILGERTTSTFRSGHDRFLAGPQVDFSLERSRLNRSWPSVQCSSAFDTVVAYEDIAAAKRAKETWDRIRTSLRSSFVFDMHLWRFDALRIPELQQTAVRDATRAQLVIVATHGEGDLPREAKSWIDSWVHDRPARPGALILLIESRQGEPAQFRFNPQKLYLEAIARQARMHFFASISKTPIEAK